MTTAGTVQRPTVNLAFDPVGSAPLECGSLGGRPAAQRGTGFALGRSAPACLAYPMCFWMNALI